MKLVDLHVHSNASDGTMTPTELVQLAVKQELTAFALTDHDTINGVHEALAEAKRLKDTGTLIDVIPGTELSVGYKGRDIHILGLGIDENNKAFNDFLDAASKERNERNIKMTENLKNAGIDISMEQLVAENGDAVLTRAHFANHLVKVGAAKDNNDAFRKYLDASTIYYVPRKFFTPEEAIKLIHEAGGVAILAHPLLYKYSRPQVETLVTYLEGFGLDGLEVMYSMNTEADEYFVRNLARRHNLLMSGGSDFHGANKPIIQLGVGRGKLKIPYEYVEKINERREQYK